MNVTNITNASRNAIVLPWNKGDYGRNTRLQVKAAFKENLLDHMAALDPNTEINPHPLTKIICCLGPLKSSVQDIETLMEAGVTSVIIPMWLFTPEEKLVTIRNIREAVNNYSTKIDRVFPLGVGIDLRGPQVHTGRLFENEPVDVLEGTTLTLTTMPVWGENGTATKVFIDAPDLPTQIISGTDLIIDSGNILLNVSHIVDEEEIICKVMKGGKLHNNRVVHQMETPAPLKEITPSDVEDIEFAIEMGLDFISISSVRFECVVKEIRRLLDFRKSSIMLVSKIENKVAVNNLEAIVKESDAINLVRNSLAVEISEERIFLIQDNITAICKLLGKPIYIEGNILQRPMNTTIESEQIDVMDVVGALQKGVDGFVMRDTFPLQCNPKKILKNLINLCMLAEPSYWHSHFFNKLSTMASPPIDPTHAISIAVVEAAMKAGATAILVCTASGTSAKLVCRYLPRVPVIAITRYGRVARQLALFKAAVPFHYVAPAVKDWQKDVDLRFQAGIVLGKEKGFIKPGDALVLLSGWRPGAGFTNTMRMTYASQTDPWVHLKDFGLSKGRTEEAVCQSGDECPYQLY